MARERHTSEGKAENIKHGAQGGQTQHGARAAYMTRHEDGKIMMGNKTLLRVR